ncbi:MAG: CDP-alcohol phosphatidyltransferase family protein, partial [Gammaproteobacteria bacterium]|nr:CDP-alcohol phosphatidyltransferase family protein [Gammaproteobacteria bacterium]
VMAEKRGQTTHARGAKSLFFTTGLAEATETILFFIAFCLLPAWFPVLACVFAALTFYTALSRIVLAASAFRNKT